MRTLLLGACLVGFPSLRAEEPVAPVPIMTRDALGDFPSTKVAAEKGDAWAMNTLGLMYFVGHGTAEDRKEAFRWFKASAENGNPAAAQNLGAVYSYGFGTAKDPAQAIRWFRVAAAAGIIKSQLWLGMTLSTGEGAERNPKEGLGWIKQSAENGLPQAESLYGLLLWGGQSSLGIPPDRAAGLVWIRKAAEHGDSQGQYELGTRYLKGIGVPKEPAEALRWLEQSAEQESFDSESALTELGWMNLLGIGVPKDPKRGRKMLEMAAAHQSGTAATMLGDALCQGFFGEPNEETALKWYQKASELGDERAQFQIGCRDLRNAGSPGKTRDAGEALARAAKQGHPGALFLVGYAYSLGFGVKPDPKLGTRLMERSGLKIVPPKPASEETKAYVQAHPAAFRVPLTYDVRYILVRPRTTGQSATQSEQEVSSRLAVIDRESKAGVSFEDLIERHSDDPGKTKNKGLFINVPLGTMVREFEEAVVTQPIGLVGAPINTPYGRMILRVEKRIDAHPAPFESIADLAAVSMLADTLLREALRSPWGNLLQEQH